MTNLSNHNLFLRHMPDVIGIKYQNGTTHLSAHCRCSTHSSKPFSYRRIVLLTNPDFVTVTIWQNNQVSTLTIGNPVAAQRAQRFRLT